MYKNKQTTKRRKRNEMQLTSRVLSNANRWGVGKRALDLQHSFPCVWGKIPLK